MNNQERRVLSRTGTHLFFFLCTFILVLASFRCARADGDFTYELMDDGTACITGCSLTGDIRIPEKIDGYTVSTLDDQLFYNKSGITSVSLPASVIHLGKSNFNSESNTFAYIFSYCRSLTKITVDSGNPKLRSKDGVLYSKDLSVLYNYPCAKADSSYTVSEKTVRLDCTSFAAAKNLKTLTLEGYEVSWAAYTFYDDRQMTVYYKTGGGTENAVGVDYYLGHISDWGDYPTFVPYGERKPEPEDEEGRLKMPHNLRAVRTAKGVRLTWDAVDGADQYTVHRMVENGLDLASGYAVTTETSFLDTEVDFDSGYQYAYYIRAEKLDAGGSVSAYRDSLMFYYIPYDRITDLKGESLKKGEVLLRWTAQEKRYVYGYEVYYSESSKTPDLEQEPQLRIRAAETTLTELPEGKTLYFFVRPYGVILESQSTRAFSHESWSKALKIRVSDGKTASETVTVKNGVYRVSGSSAVLIKPAKKTLTQLVIPAAVQVDGKAYNVTEIAASACKNMKKLKTLVIGKNVKKIGKNAFSGCSALKKITLKTDKLTSSGVGSSAFKGIYKKAVFQCPKDMRKKYAKFLVEKGAAKTCTFK